MLRLNVYLIILTITSLSAIVNCTSDDPCEGDGEIWPNHVGNILGDVMGNITFGDFVNEVVVSSSKACICKRKTCIQKCCDVGEYRVGDLCTASSLGTKFIPKNFGLMNSDVHILYDVQCKGIKYDVETMLSKIEKDGSATVNGQYGTKIFGHEDYCIDLEKNHNLSMASYVLMTCLETWNSWSIFKNAFLGFFHFLSFIFLLLILGVYIYIRDLHNIHGYFLMLCTSTLSIPHLCFFVSYLWPFMTTSSASKDFCYGIGYLNYFFTAANCFWIDVMCFDIFYAFLLNLQMINERKKGEIKNRRRFVYYNLIVWAAATYLTVTCIISENHSYLTSFIVSPGESRTSCSFFEKLSHSPYLYLPVGVFLVFNCFILTFTIFNAKHVKKELHKRFVGGNCKTFQYKYDNNRLDTYLEIFFILAASWLLKIMCAHIIIDDLVAVFFGDYFNSMVGIFIACLLLYRGNIMHLYKKRINNERKFNIADMSSYRSRTTIHTSSINSKRVHL